MGIADLQFGQPEISQYRKGSFHRRIRIHPNSSEMRIHLVEPAYTSVDSRIMVIHSPMRLEGDCGQRSETS